MKFNGVLAAEKSLHGLTWTCQSHQYVCNLKKFSSSVYCSRVCASPRLSLEDVGTKDHALGFRSKADNKHSANYDQMFVWK